ncbi:ATP-binding protein [Lysinibacillus piscis]|uniref:histidine kinase n=1 Tax=Lysinibacillus piscis TaxID=2518931 RepID=A0ABQ5NH60_9BACI|nr:ATP-binding protein [Lysinibacillus sp. KH24]GLC87700.1 hypothetical protein LYSBPC_08270 [Lysinibacillus sp. KH24]
MSKRYSMAVMILVYIILLFVPRAYAQIPLSQAGVMDLSTWNFQQDGKIKLDGEWTFYPHQLLTPTQITNTSSLESVSLQVPSRWIGAGIAKPMQDQGIGTYHLTVKIDATEQQRYGLKLVNVRAASKVFVNGKEVGSVGQPASSIEQGYKSQVAPLTTFFTAEAATIDVVVQVANLDYYNGGIIQSIFLGSEKDILATHMRATILDVISISGLLLSSIYYISIYIKRRKDKRFLYFASSCVSYAFIMATGNEKVFYHFLPNMPFLYVIKLKIVAVCLSIIFISLFIRELESAFIPRIYSRGIVLVMLGNIALVTCIPSSYLFIVEKCIAPSYILSYLCMALLIRNSIKHRTYTILNRQSAFFILISIVLVLMVFLSDFLYFYSIIKTDIMSIIVLFYFLIGTTIFLIGQYIKAYNDLEKMSNELIETDKLKDEFLIRTSHEFKTPLHGIVDIARVAIQQGTEKQQENLSYIITLASRLSTLVNDIIDFQNIRHNRLRIQCQLFDVNGTVQAIIDMFQHMKKNDAVQLINRIPSGMYYMYTDENRCKQILVNLVSNALNHTVQGYIEIRATSQGNLIAIHVIDTGSGISEKMQSQLFENEELSANIDSAMTARTIGMGLAISKQLAIHMEGSLDLEDSTVGIGSHFVMALPKASAEQVQAYKREKALTLPRTEEVKLVDHMVGKRIKILLVDDEPLTNKLLQEIFPSDEYETLIAYDGQQALHILSKTKDVAIVLLDVMMPNMSGYEVCQQIRQRYPLYELPILLLTIRNTTEDIAKGLEVGANDFLAKPLDMRELKARVTTLLKMKEAMQEAIQMETVFLQSQIQPHFLYNALSIIMSLCYSNPERAGQLLGELSNYLRKSFDMNPKQSLISLKTELSHVQSYVVLEKARFGSRLEVEFEIAEEALLVQIPALIIQPLVENAIRHGLLKRRAGGTVVITAYRVSDVLQITIHDNGIGMSAEKVNTLLESTALQGHIGLKNVHKRLIIEYGQGLTINSLEGVGTTVHITIPFSKKMEETE